MKKLISTLKPFIDRMPLIASGYRYIRDSRQLSSKPQKTPQGFLFIGNKEMQQGKFEPVEVELISKILPKIDIFINIGANIGYYCCIARKHGKYVVAFEPLPLNAQYLLKNIKINKFDQNFELFQMALNNQVGIVDIFGGGMGASLIKGWAKTPDHYVNHIPSSTLDLTLAERFLGKKCLVLVDVEGSEYNMLKGASIFIQRDPKPIWLIEISITEHWPGDYKINPKLLPIFEIFWENGYESFTADKNCRVVHRAEIEKICKTKEDTLNTHNFLFIESKKEFT